PVGRVILQQQNAADAPPAALGNDQIEFAIPVKSAARTSATRPMPSTKMMGVRQASTTSFLHRRPDHAHENDDADPCQEQAAKHPKDDARAPCGAHQKTHWGSP